MNRSALLFAMLLASCMPEARDIALADVDLRDMDAVAQIRSRLEPHESVAFANYIVRHHRMAANFCGQPLVGISGQEPATIGEAVDLSILRDKAEREAALEASRPKHPRQIAKEEWDKLVTARDMFTQSQSRLRMEFGEKALRRSEWKSLEADIADIDQKLVALKPDVFGLGD